MQRTIKLRNMDTALARGLQAPGNDFIQRQAIEEIIRNAYFAAEPVLDYLLAKLAPPPTVIPCHPDQGGTYKCPHPHCKDTFKSQMALNGHMKKHAKP